jgi:Pectate lyase superfamily protein
VPLGVRDGGGMPITRRQFLGAGVAVGASLVLAWHLRGTHSLGVYNVQDYGAVGDGSMDDTAAIDAAITAAAATGGTVWFPTGTYQANSLTISGPGVTLRGDGATIRRNASAGMLTVSGSRTTIAGLTFDGNYSAFLDDDKSDIVISAAATDVTIADCRFVNGGNHNVITVAGDAGTDPIERVTVRGCYFDPCDVNGYHVWMPNNIRDVLITDNSFVLGPDDGTHDPVSVYCRSFAGTVDQVPRYVHITNNLFEMQAGSGAGGHPQAIVCSADGTATFNPHDIVIADNSFRMLGEGFTPISFSQVDKAAIVANTVTAPSGYSIYTGFEIGGTQITIADNVLDGGGSFSHGIILNDASKNRVVGNYITGIRDEVGLFHEGIQLYKDGSSGGNDQNVIADNTIEIPDGLHMAIRIEMNTASALTASGNIIVGNNIVGKGGTDSRGVSLGLDVAGASIDSTLIAQNTITDVGYAVVDGGTNTLISANRAVSVTTPVLDGDGSGHQIDNSWQ